MPPQSDLNARLSPNEQARLRRQFIVATINAQAAWLDKAMKKILPKALYRAAHNESPPYSEFEKRQQMVGEWLDKNDVRIVSQGTHIQRIFQGKKLISTLVVKPSEE